MMMAGASEKFPAAVYMHPEAPTFNISWDNLMLVFYDNLVILDLLL